MQRNLEFFTFAECEELARGVADRLDLSLRPIEVQPFPDGESLVRVESKTPGGAALALEAIIEAQGPVDLPVAAAFRVTVESRREGRIRSVDCLGVNRIAKLAGSHAHPAAGIKCLRRVGDVVGKNEPLFEIHAQSRTQLDMAQEYATSALSTIVHYGY